MSKKYSYTGPDGHKHVSYLHLHFPLASLAFPLLYKKKEPHHKLQPRLRHAHTCLKSGGT